MEIRVTKLTDISLMHKAINFTMRNEIKAKMSLDSCYKCKHSPMRTQIFCIEMYGIPSFVSTHLVRHSAVGQQHFVGTNRDDRDGDKVADRWTPVDHMMVLNAQHLIDMAHARLCFKSHTETTRVMLEIRDKVCNVDIELREHMVPRCLYLNRCDELKSCGYIQGVQHERD